jgi:transcriptional regulator with XRE-family HTH domain
MLALPLILISGAHIRAARGLLGWTQKELAKRGEVALGTLRKMEESGDAVDARTDTLIKVMTALDKAGIIFLNDDSPGVRLRPKTKS